MYQVMPVCVGFAPRKREMPSMWVKDERLPKARNPQEVMSERIQESMLENAKNKPDEERNIFDYFVLITNKLKEMQENSVCYMA